ncbi:MAG: OmpA family protein [Nitrospirota bacterium]|nr:OmpA family protein [Nitrospirota bacterium]
MKRLRILALAAGVALVGGTAPYATSFAQEEDEVLYELYEEVGPSEEQALPEEGVVEEELTWPETGAEVEIPADTVEAPEAGAMEEEVAQAPAQPEVTTEEQPYYRFVKAPNFFGTTGLTMTPTANTIGNLKFHVGVYGNFFMDDNDTIRKNNKVYYLQPVVGVGITDYIEVSGSFPYVWYEGEYKVRQGYPWEGERHKDDQGDYRLTAKFKILDPRKFPVGVAVVGFSQFGTGPEEVPGFTGEDTYGVRGVFTYEKEWFILTTALGANFNQAPSNYAGNNWNNTTFAYEVGAGVAPLEDLMLMVEYRGQESRTRGGDRDVTMPDGVQYRYYNDRPQAILASARYHLGRGFMLTAGMDFGMSHSVDDYRGIVGFTWSGPTPPKPMKERVVEVPVEKVVVKEVPKVVRVERLVFSDINFEFDKSTLTNLGKGKTYLIAQKLKESQNVKVVIAGHADYIGSEQYNLNLARRRAETIRKELLKLGVSSEQIGDIVSYGESKPLVDMKQPWARAVNRRVEFEVMGAEPVQEETIEEGAPSEWEPFEEAPSQEEAPEELQMDEVF